MRSSRVTRMPAVGWSPRPRSASLQAEISGLSRSVSNLGSSFGTAIAGTILVSDLASGNTTYVLAMVVLAALALIGLAAATRLPSGPDQHGTLIEPITAHAPPPATQRG